MVPVDAVGHSGPWVVFGSGAAPGLSDQCAALEAAGGKVVHLDSRDLLDDRAVYRTLADRFEFPGYFGWNWDAVVDCLDSLCGAFTGGVGALGVVHNADLLVEADHLRLLVSVLCQGAARANSAVDLDGDELDRPAVALHFYLCLDDAGLREVAARIEHEDLVVTVRDGYVTADLNPEVWFA